MARILLAGVSSFKRAEMRCYLFFLHFILEFPNNCNSQRVQETERAVPEVLSRNLFLCACVGCVCLLYLLRG